MLKDKNLLFIQSIIGLIRIYSALEIAYDIINETKNNSNKDSNIFVNEFDQIILSMNNDVNTPNVYASVFDAVRKFNSNLKNSMNRDLAIHFISFLNKIGDMLGLFSEDPTKFLKQLNLILLREKKISLDKINNKITERNLARNNKDYKKADLIRDKLLKLGIELKDSINGTKWSVKI